jgi:hypothetical protein
MNVIGMFRSNYFRVKHTEVFSAWCDRRGLVMVEHAQDRALVGFRNLTNESGIPWMQEQEAFDVRRVEEFDLLAELSEHLAGGTVAIVMELQWEGQSYLMGTAYAINARGERKTVWLGQINDLAEQLGTVETLCED